VCAATPGLRHDWRWRGRDLPKFEKRTMPGPDSTFAPLVCDKSSGVVGRAHQAVRRRRAPVRLERTNAFLAQVSASASSSGVKLPCSFSNPATASSRTGAWSATSPPSHSGLAVRLWQRTPQVASGERDDGVVVSVGPDLTSSVQWSNHLPPRTGINESGEPRPAP
jgi:hypothetical protein